MCLNRGWLSSYTPPDQDYAHRQKHIAHRANQRGEIDLAGEFGPVITAHRSASAHEYQELLVDISLDGVANPAH